LPPNLSYYFCLDYERSGRLYDFWKKLEDALKDPTKEPLLSMKSIDPNQEKKIEKKQEKFMKLVTSNGIKRNCSDEKLSVVMPPAPKIREASSMFNLTDIGVSEMVEPKKKKKKWYKKILKSPSFLKFENHSEPLSELDEKIPKKKKKWFKKKEAIPAC
jgi:myeloid differentiation primary response protein MyD88